MTSTTDWDRIPKEHVDGCRAVALGFTPRCERPFWAAKGLRRGCSANDQAFYEQHPLDWPGIQATLRRGRLALERAGIRVATFAELEEYEALAGGPPPWRELVRLELLLTEAIEIIEPKLQADPPHASRAFGDLHWARDFVRRMSGSTRFGRSRPRGI